MIELLFGIIITIVAVVIVEVFVQNWQKGYNQKRLINALYHEILNNIAVSQANKKLPIGGRYLKYFLYPTIAYEQYKLGIVIDKTIRKSFLDELFKAYSLINWFNRNVEEFEQNRITRDKHKQIFQDIETYLDNVRLELQPNIKSNEV